jgi:hypothetical protein
MGRANTTPTFNQNWILPILLLVLAGLVTVLTMLSPNQQNAEPLADRSIYNSAPTGYRAWYLTSKKAGIPILVWEKPFFHLHELPSPATMLIVEPYTVDKSSIIFGDKEVTSLLKWVQQGNTLVLLDNFKRYGSSYVTHVLALELESTQSSRRLTNNYLQPILIHPAKSILASFITQPILTGSRLGFRITEPNSLLTTTPDEVLLETKNHEPLMIRRGYGQGTIILGTTGDLGANSFLHGPTNDNYQFLSNLLIQEQKPVFINEFIHGYVEAGDLLSYYQKQTPLGPIFGQLVLGFIVLLWLSFVRWTPKPVETAEQLSTDTGSGLDAYIQSLAGIYCRTNASPLAIAPLLSRIDALLQRKFRVPLNEDAQLHNLLTTVFGTYSSKDETPDSVLATLQKAQAVSRKQTRLQPRELLRLVQQLTIIEEKLQHYGQRHPAIRR